MSKSNRKFNQLKDTSCDPKFAVYWTLGYPDLQTSIQIMEELGNHGADIIEIGIPFSDPIADGPTIQYSSQISLENGITIDNVWEAVKQVKSSTNSKVVIMTYSNIIFKYGTKRFAEIGRKNNIDGVILPDMPPELYPSELINLNPIHLIAPNSELSRLENAVTQTGMFVYLTSQLNTTGNGNLFDVRIQQIINQIRELDQNIPIMVGFGISTHHDVERITSLGANGVIIGSVLIKTYKETQSCNRVIGQFNEIKNGIV